MRNWEIKPGHALEVLKGMPSGSVHCCVTSPPYFWLRSYGTEPQVWPSVSYAPMPGLPNLEIPGDPECDHRWGSELVLNRKAVNTDKSTLKGPQIPDTRGQSNGQYCQKCGAWRGSLGLEPTLDMYIGHLVLICREIKRVLRDDGVFWLNIGDSYSQEGKWGGGSGHKNYTSLQGGYPRHKRHTGVKEKELLLIPARLALALQADGWFIRRDVIWGKLNGLPESIDDRPSSAHEYIWMLTKSSKPTFWTHRDGTGARVKPTPDYRWIHRETGEEAEAMPAGWKTDKQVKAQWRRLNLWRGRSYFFDMEAVREAPAPASIARISQESLAEQTGGDKDYGANGVAHHRSARQALEGFAANPGRNLRSVWTQGETVQATFNLLRAFVSAGTPQNVLDRAWQAFLRMLGTPDDLWRFSTEPYPEAHFAVFNPKLPEICIRSSTSDHGCCPKCGAPWTRVLKRVGKAPVQNGLGTNKKVFESQTQVGQTSALRSGLKNVHETAGWQPTCGCGTETYGLDITRPQAKRALELARDHGLTQRHIEAIRAVGITDTGKAAETQHGTGENDSEVKRLAAEAKQALRGYYREFLLGKPATAGWQPSCQCESLAPVPCIVLDPFAGAATTLLVADRLGRRGIGIELNQEYIELAEKRLIADAPLFALASD